MSESTGSLPVRHNARVLLINELNELLLMRVELPAYSFWCTIGGGTKPGETAEMAVKREAQEEIGFDDADIQWEKAVWYGEHVMDRKGAPTLHKETFVLGRTSRRQIDDAGQTDDEKKVVKEFKWWSLEELRTTNEFIVPPSIIIHLPPILRGEIPEKIITIDLKNTPPSGADISAPAPRIY